jgi:hypothetical protein
MQTSLSLVGSETLPMKHKQLPRTRHLRHRMKALLNLYRIYGKAFQAPLRWNSARASSGSDGKSQLWKNRLQPQT